MSKKKNRPATLLRAVTTALKQPERLAADPIPFAYFDRAYLINRDSETRRLEMMSKRLRQLGMMFERFPATEAQPDQPAIATKPQLTPGYFACARSHLAVLQSALQRGYKRVIVLEDDAVFRDDAVERMARIVPRLRGIEWDLFFFGLHLMESGGHIAPELGVVRRSFHAHAYAVSLKAMPAVIEIIETAMRQGFHFDCFELLSRPLLRVYADPILAVQEPNLSAVLGKKVDRLGQYFPPFDRGEFISHCAEAREWGNGAEVAVKAKRTRPSPGVPGEGVGARRRWQRNRRRPTPRRLQFHRSSGMGLRRWMRHARTQSMQLRPRPRPRPRSLTRPRL